ncbi:MAG: S-layer homology domain-containing protein [Acidimicrobiales bacterium]|nr:S-layer homology domain-containing protein [Acidimicrobiales bacterium]
MQTHERCEGDYPGVYDPATMRCTAAPDEDAPADACTGDSGGPLVTTDDRGRARQVGIVSFGTALRCAETPAVYLTTGAVHAWIGSVTGIVTFSDLVGTPHADAIIALAERGIASGRTDGTYGPNQPITRAQMATVLTRALGLTPTPADFDDVPADHPHNASIGAVVAAGITSGRADGTFGPDAAVNRGQMATFLLRALSLDPQPADVPDVDISHPHYHSIGAIMDAGISTGRADGTFAPELTVTRGQLASFLTRALGVPVG